MPYPSSYRFAEIDEGMTVHQSYTLTSNVCDFFVKAFDDRSPIHIDDEYAVARGFQQRVVHGAVLSGFLSNFVGMRFPGESALWLSLDLRYLKPSYWGDELTLEATVLQKVETGQVLVIGINFHNVTQGLSVARGRLQVSVRND